MAVERVTAEGGHPARPLSQGPACPKQPSLINPLTGASDIEQLRPTQKGHGVNQPSLRPSNQDGRTSSGLSPNQRFSDALSGTPTQSQHTPMRT